MRIAAIATILQLMGVSFSSSHAASLSKADEACLDCHSDPDAVKKLENGETLRLLVDEDHYKLSAHGDQGCTSCHDDINARTHPKDAKPIASLRAFSVQMAKQICTDCHEKEAKLWGQSVHAVLVQQSDTKAPICTDCHSQHTMVKGAAKAIATVPCQSCHQRIYSAYLTSVHGEKRRHGDQAAPLCFNCHGSHDISVASAGVGRRDVCLGCHTKTAETHSAWLPNVDLHFGVVSCPVCHTPNAQRVVNLILYSNATQKEISEPHGIPEFEPGANQGGAPGLDPRTLVSLISTLNRDGAQGRTMIHGRLDVRSGIEDHQLAMASQAISDCHLCHQKGAAAFQSVVVSVAGSAGIPVRYTAASEVLSSVLSLNSVSGFYAIGGTRITLLDGLVMLAFLGGVGWSLAHLAARFVVGRFLNRPPPPSRQG